jgi:hypothetical protein
MEVTMNKNDSANVSFTLILSFFLLNLITLTYLNSGSFLSMDLYVQQVV